MGWLRRVRRDPVPEDTRKAPEEAPPAAVERSSPGLAALFAGIRGDGSHSLLDLGAASESHLELYGRYARRVRFADLLTAPPRGAVWRSVLQAEPRPAHPEYDLVLAWNILDMIPAAERREFLTCLADITSPGARLYASVDSSGNPTVQPQRFTILGPDRVAQQPAGPPRAAQRPILPAEIERLLAPFEVRHAFTLRMGWREYVALREGAVR